MTQKVTVISQNLPVHCLNFSLFYLLFKSLNCIQFLKVTFHLQLLQNIGYIPHVVQYIPEPILYLIVCPLTPLHFGSHLFILCFYKSFLFLYLFVLIFKFQV